MKAVCFSVTIPGFLAAKTIGRVFHNAPLGIFGNVRLREVPAPELPGPEWVGLDVIAGGICGTDLSTIFYKGSTSLEPFGSFPAVLGHEILARVTTVGDRVDGVETGQRVAINPMISCTMRGFDDSCLPCRDGHPGTCHHGADEGPLEIAGHRIAPGLTIGYHRDLPGAYGERLVAHQRQLFVVPEGIPDETAVITEPLSIGLHAVLRTRLNAAEPVLVIGSGAIAMSTIWALAATGFNGEIISQTKRPHEAELARALGATANVTPGAEAVAALAKTGARAYQPIIGDPVYAGGGFPVIFDCVGNAASLDQALRFAAPRGRVVVLGCAAEIPNLDLTPLWARELSVIGYVGYAPERWQGEQRHTFEIAHQLMLEHGAELPRMVTHRFDLGSYKQALKAAANHRLSKAVKVIFENVSAPPA